MGAIGLCSEVIRGLPNQADPLDRRARPTRGTRLEWIGLSEAAYFFGSSNTYSVWPFTGGFTSGMIVRGTWRGLPPPLPVVTATYCLPLAVNVTGKPWTDVSRRIFHSSSPVLTSRAR